MAETYLMANPEASTAAAEGVNVCSPQSPLGMALLGAVVGDEREFFTPDRRRMKVTVLRAVPHRPTGRS
jgi:transcription elongation factor GreA